MTFFLGQFGNTSWKCYKCVYLFTLGHSLRENHPKESVVILCKNKLEIIEEICKKNTSKVFITVSFYREKKTIYSTKTKRLQKLWCINKIDGALVIQKCII